MNRLRPVLAAVLVVSGLGAGGWLLWHRSDCAISEDAGQQWAALMAATNDSFDRGTFYQAEFQALADMEAKMVDTLRSAARDVSSPELAEHLDVWADSTALNLEVQREDSTSWGELPPPDVMAKLQHSQELYLQSTDLLVQRCPALGPKLHLA